jgi:homoserine kinase type II
MQADGYDRFRLTPPDDGDMSTDTAHELREVLAHYDLGTLLESERDERGTVNTSFIVDLQKDGAQARFFLRRYKPEIRPEELEFEHALIDHLTARGSCPVARVHRTRSGSSFLQLRSPSGKGACYAIFDYLPGEDRYTWVDPRCTLGELRRAGTLLAQFHSDVASLKPPGRRAEPRIAELLPVIEGAWSECLARSTDTAFDRYAAGHDGIVRESLADAERVLGRAAGRLPEVIIHSDYHPGNLRFLGSEISGLVDFDWAKVDLRAFDVGLAVWYFCVSWRRGADGRVRLGAARAFLEAYQRRLIAEGDVSPLTAAELTVLPHLISAGNLYVLYWGLRDYLSKPVDAQEYLVYLRHSIAFSRWFEKAAHRSSLTNLLHSLPRSAGRSQRSSRPAP